MRNYFKPIFTFFLLLIFVFSLLRTSGLSLTQCSEEEVEMLAKIGGNEEDDELTYDFEEFVSHNFENSVFEEKNASKIHRVIFLNYAEPNLESLSYPPEQAV